MTSERKKSILILSTTLVVGILLGLLIPGLFMKFEKRGKFGNREHQGSGPSPHPKKEWFVGTLQRILQPDSAQAKQIKPIAQWASAQIDTVESNANQQMSSILDSVRIQLKPILNPDQQKRLSDFDANAKKTWDKREGRSRN